MNARQQRNIGLILTGGVLLYALLSFFEQAPFLQQEMVYQAKWWNDPGLPFFENLFNPDHQDYGVGRFRYVEYLSEAAYWKLMHYGWIPRDLYDFSAWLVTGALNFFLWRMGRRRGLSGWSLGLLSAVLWLSLPTFMVSTWHYRKAKPLASLFLVILAARWEKSPGGWDLPLLGLLVLGFFTDPFFILFAPLLMLALKPREWKTLIAGYSVAFVLLVLVNGVIGPRFHPGTKLILGSIPYKPVNLLSPAQWILFPEVLPQLLGFPRWNDLPGIAIALIFFLLAAVLGLGIRQRQAQWKYLAVFLVGLPISAVVIHPSFFTQIGTYASYYGHVTFALFLLALLDILTIAERTRIAALRWSLAGALVFVIGLHQFHRTEVFESWTREHFLEPSARAKFNADYALLNRVRTQPELRRQIPPLPWPNEPLHLYSDAGGQWPHTSLAYAFIPAIFPTAN